MYKVETEQEEDGRWIAEVPELPGVLAYGATKEEAVRRAQALSLRVLAERLDHGETLPDVQAIFEIVTGEGDYAVDRHAWLDKLTVDDIVKSIEQRRKGA